MKRHWNDVDAETQDSIQFFYDAAIAQYPIESLILFGSRARGDFDKHSDADVLILMKTNSDDEIDLARIAFVDIAFDVMLKTGILISPLPIQYKYWLDPAKFSNPSLLENIKMDGILYGQ